MPILNIIVPVYNEEKFITKIIKDLDNLKVPYFKKNIIVVNDASSDSTPKKLLQSQKKYKFTLINHKTNQGKGATIITSLKQIHSGLTIIQDADPEYSPTEIVYLTNHLKTNPNSIIYGSRYVSRQNPTGYLHIYLANLIINKLVNLRHKTQLTDIFTCYKLIPTKILKDLNLTSTGFEIELELTLKMLKKGLKISEIPIKYQPRSFKDGKKIKLKHLFSILYAFYRF